MFSPVVEEHRGLELVVILAGEQERAKRLENVRLARVVLAELAACLGGLDGLEERSEDGWADARPVEGTRAHELLAHRGGEAGDVEPLLEDPAVHVRETRGQLVEGRLTALHGCAQRLVEDCELRAEVAAVFAGPGVQELGEQVTFPQARVVTVETKKGANEEYGGLVVAVA